MAAAAAADDLDAAAVGLGEFARNGESQARSLGTPERTGPAAEKCLENRFALLRRHAGPAVDDIYRGQAGAFTRLDENFSAGRGELDRIAEQVVDYRAQFRGVRPNGERRDVERHALRLGLSR